MSSTLASTSRGVYIRDRSAGAQRRLALPSSSNNTRRSATRTTPRQVRSTSLHCIRSSSSTLGDDSTSRPASFQARSYEEAETDNAGESSRRSSFGVSSNWNSNLWQKISLESSNSKNSFLKWVATQRRTTRLCGSTTSLSSLISFIRNKLLHEQLLRKFSKTNMIAFSQRFFYTIKIWIVQYFSSTDRLISLFIGLFSLILLFTISTMSVNNGVNIERTNYTINNHGLSSPKLVVDRFAMVVPNSTFTHQHGDNTANSGVGKSSSQTAQQVVGSMRNVSASNLRHAKNETNAVESSPVKNSLASAQASSQVKSINDMGSSRLNTEKGKTNMIKERNADADNEERRTVSNVEDLKKIATNGVFEDAKKAVKLVSIRKNKLNGSLSDLLPPPKKNNLAMVDGGVYMPEIPKLLDEKLSDISNKFLPGIETPYFWHVPLSGGTAVEKMLGSCYYFVQVSDVAEKEKNDPLKVIQMFGNAYVNTDITTKDGINRANALGLLTNGLADVAVTPLLYESSNIFSSRHKGRLFALFHHPIERSVSMFYYLRKATHDPGYSPRLANITIEEWAKDGKLVERNWLTRFLSNKRKGLLSREHLDIAKKVLRRKCVVGLLNEFELSMSRFDRIFGWKDAMDSNAAKECRSKIIVGKDRRHFHPKFAKESKVWKLLEEHNSFDLELYEYAKELFRSQANLLPSFKQIS